jgi:hypothetical protein
MKKCKLAFIICFALILQGIQVLGNDLEKKAECVIKEDEITNKLAADVRFIELIKIEFSFQHKFRSLSTEDKQLFRAALKEKNISTMLGFFRKCGIDFKNYISSRTPLLIALDKDYELDKRSDKEQIIRAAVAKTKLFDPPTFAECLLFWSSGSAYCTEICQDDENCLVWCWGGVMALFLDCLAALP